MMLEPTELTAVGGGSASLDFETFFRDEHPQLARACFLLTGDAAEAEDLAQEAMARAYERWDRVGAMDSPAGYVYRTAFNLNRKRVRRLGVRAKQLVAAIPEHDPARIAEARNEVIRALDSVPKPQREALILVGWLGMDANEAADVLGIDAASVRGRMHRARVTLRKSLGEDDDE